MAKISFNEERCKGCALCVSACPKGILEIDLSRLNHRGHTPACCKDESACVGCACCALMCPDCAITIER